MIIAREIGRHNGKCYYNPCMHWSINCGMLRQLLNVVCDYTKKKINEPTFLHVNPENLDEIVKFLPIFKIFFLSIFSLLGHPVVNMALIHSTKPLNIKTRGNEINSEYCHWENFSSSRLLMKLRCAVVNCSFFGKIEITKTFCCHLFDSTFYLKTPLKVARRITARYKIWHYIPFANEMPDQIPQLIWLTSLKMNRLILLKNIYYAKFPLKWIAFYFRPISSQFIWSSQARSNWKCF